MDYFINIKKKIPAEEFASELVTQILDRLEKLEEMIPDDLEEIESPLCEISEYLENVQDQVAIVKKENEEEAEKLRQHEKSLQGSV